MSNQESSFSSLLHRKLLILNPSIYIEKTSNRFRRGLPDFYYEGKGNILWAEHKWIAQPWKTDKNILYDTPSWLAQRQWLERACSNNRNALVIIGIGKGKSTMVYMVGYPFAFFLDKHIPLSLDSTIIRINNLIR